MKQIFTLVISCLYFSTISAQTEKGKFALSAKTDASMMFGRTRVVVDSGLGQKQDTRAFSANLGVAYFVANNLAVGISGSFKYSRVEADFSSFYYQTYTAGVIPTVTYFFPLKGKIKPSLSAGVGYLWLFTTNLDSDGLSLNVAPAVSFFINRNISFDLGVQYSYSDLKDKSGSSDLKYKQQTIGILAGLSIYF